MNENESTPFIDSVHSFSRPTAGNSTRLINFVIFALMCVIVYLVVTRQDGFYSQYVSQYDYRKIIWNLSTSSGAKADTAVEESSSVRMLVETTKVLETTSTTAPVTTSLLTSTPSTIIQSTISTTAQPPITTLTTLPTSTLAAAITAARVMAIPGTQNYITTTFFATCSGGGISNKLFEFVSLYGIARTLDRVPYANLMNDCMLNHMKEMLTYFPQITLAIELKVVSKEMTTEVDFGKAKCCTYEDVGKLLAYNSSRFIAITGNYLQSYKYFHEHKEEVLKLLTFTDEDIIAAEKIANETFKNDTNHKICVHIRRGDYLKSVLHQVSTENFTMTSVLYVREILMKKGVNTTVALLGDDRPWAKTLFANISWAVVPERTNRTTTDYAFVARHCQTVILTASASTFGFWSAYLSSAENVYYNEKFSISTQLSNELNPADFFPPTWISLRLNETSNIVTEVRR